MIFEIYFIDHSKTAITLPYLYEGQDLSKQWTELLIDSHGKIISYHFFLNKSKYLSR